MRVQDTGEVVELPECPPMDDPCCPVGPCTLLPDHADPHVGHNSKGIPVFFWNQGECLVYVVPLEPTP